MLRPQTKWWSCCWLLGMEPEYLRCLTRFKAKTVAKYQRWQGQSLRLPRRTFQWYHGTSTPFQKSAKHLQKESCWHATYACPAPRHSGYIESTRPERNSVAVSWAQDWRTTPSKQSVGHRIQCFWENSIQRIRYHAEAATGDMLVSDGFATPSGQPSDTAPVQAEWRHCLSLFLRFWQSFSTYSPSKKAYKTWIIHSSNSNCISHFVKCVFALKHPITA